MDKLFIFSASVAMATWIHAVSLIVRSSSVCFRRRRLHHQGYLAPVDWIFGANRMVSLTAGCTDNKELEGMPSCYLHSYAAWKKWQVQVVATCVYDVINERNVPLWSRCEHTAAFFPFRSHVSIVGRSTKHSQPSLVADGSYQHREQITEFRWKSRRETRWNWAFRADVFHSELSRKKREGDERERSALLIYSMCIKCHNIIIIRSFDYDNQVRQRER